jgi:hypothetical protein
MISDRKIIKRDFKSQSMRMTEDRIEVDRGWNGVGRVSGMTTAIGKGYVYIDVDRDVDRDRDEDGDGEGDIDRSIE